MPKASPIQYAFNGGQLGPRLQGRADLARYATGCNVLENFIPTYQGPALKRSGFRYVKEVNDSTEKVRLIPFEFSREQAYMLELGEGYLRVMKDGGALLEAGVTMNGVSPSAANPVGIVTLSPHGYTTGDEVFLTNTDMDEVNDRFFTITVTAGSTFTLDGENGIGRTSGSSGSDVVARTYEIVDGGSVSLPWLETELDELSFVQTADVLYLAHPNHPPHKISRVAEDNWTSEEIAFDWPPFRDENTDDDLLMSCSENTGTGKQINLRGQLQDQLTITSTSNADPCVVSLADTTGLANGDTVFIDEVVTATVLNQRHYVVANLITNTSFEITVGSTPPAGTGGFVDKLLSTDFQFTADMKYVKLREIPESFVARHGSAATLSLSMPMAGAILVGAPTSYDGNVYVWNGIGNDTFGKKPPVHDRESDGYVNDGGSTTAVDLKFYNRNEGYVEITSVAADGYSATADVIVDLPYTLSDTHPVSNSLWPSHPSTRWSEGAWNAENGYPAAVAFYEDRLWFASTAKDPQTFWASRTGEYEDFEVIADQDDSSLTFTLASEKINAIQWMSGEDVLLIGTAGGEFTADAGNAEQAITPSNIRVRRRSNYGSAANVQPVYVDSALLFAQRSATRLHELIYSFQTDRYVAPDLTQMSYDILTPGVVQLAYQSSPLRMLWAVLSDGSLASLTYIREEEVLGWAKHIVGGSDVVVESIAVIPHPDGDQDQLWAIVKRTVDSATVRYIEYLEKPFADDAAVEDAFFVDSGLTYDGTAATTLYGLAHLEGETVNVLGDGVVQAAQVVSDGQITVSSVTKAQVGLAMPEAKLQTMRLEAGAADGTAMGRRKRVYGMVIRLKDTAVNLRYGSDFGTGMDEVELTGLYTGDTEDLTNPDGWEQDGRVALAHDEPVPCTIVAVMPQLETESD